MSACGLDFGTSNSGVALVRSGAVALAHVDAHQPLAPTLHVAPHALGVAEQLARETSRQLAAERLDDFGLRAGGERVDELGDHRLDGGLALRHRGRSEIALHQQPLLVVTRIVCPSRSAVMVSSWRASPGGTASQ